MLRTTLASLASLLAAQAALACSCVVEDESAAAAAEYQSADIVIEGYLLGAQVTPLTTCSNDTVPIDAFQPVGLFRVIEADKGASENSTIIAKLGGVSPVSYDEDCSLKYVGDSCQQPFNAESFGSVDTPKWLAFTLRDGELWANTHICSAFAGNGQDVVARFSKRGNQ
jgi:hypothetical protein